MNTLNFIKLSSITLLGLSLAACDGFDPNEFQQPIMKKPDLTGQQKDVIDEIDGEKVRLNYTGIGKSELFKKLRDEVLPNLDKSLSESIVDVEVIPVNNSLSPVKSKPRFLKVNVSLRISDKDYALKFLNKVKAKAGSLVSRFVTASNHKDYELKAECYDTSCRSVGLKLRQISKQKTVSIDSTNGKPTAGALVLYEKPTVEVQNSTVTEKLDNQSWNHLKKKYDGGSLRAEQKSVAVIEGPSYSSGVVMAQPDGTEKEVVLLEYKTPRLSTDDSTYKVDNIELYNGHPQDSKQTTTNSVEPKISAKTVGNAGGNLVLELTQEGQSDENLPLGRVFIVPDQKLVEKERALLSTDPSKRQMSGQQNALPINSQTSPDGPPVATQSKPSDSAPVEIPNGAVVYPNAIIPIPITDEFPGIKSVHQKLARYKNDPWVKYFIKAWQRNKPNQFCEGKPYYYTRSKAENFFRKIQPLLPHFLAVSFALDTTPSVAYLSALESSYATKSDNDYVEAELAVEDPRPTRAVGALQIRKPTGDDILNRYGKIIKTLGFDLSVYNLKSTLETHDNDFRNYSATSFLAASIYMKEKFNEFPDDPALGLVAYNKGAAGASVLRECVATIHADKGETHSEEDLSEEVRNCVYKKMRSRNALNQAFSTRHKYFKTGLYELAKYRMGAKCDAIRYAYGFLALKFIGERPTDYSFKPPHLLDYSELSPTPYPKGKTFPLKLVEPGPWRVGIAI